MKLLPVKYSGQTNAWMTTTIFHDWFHNHFVQEKLSELGQEPRAVLVLDNCSAHPDEKELVSDDGEIFAHFLPPNVTSLIQPMDQSVLQSIKKRYKKKLLRRLIIEDDLGESIVSFLKRVNMKVVVNLVAEAWGEISNETLRRSWQKIIPISPESIDASPLPDPTPSLVCDSPIDPIPMLKELLEVESDDDAAEGGSSLPGDKPRGYGIWRGIRFRISHQPDGDPEVLEFQELFKEIGYDMDANELVEWLQSDANDSGVQVYTDNEICELVIQPNPEEDKKAEDSEQEDEEGSCPISNSRAAHMFEQCLSWLEYQPEATVYNTSMLLELHAMAAKKRMSCLKQASLKKYFH